MLWKWIAKKWASKLVSNILVAVVVATIGLGVTAWYKKSADLAKCELKFASLEIDMVRAEVEWQKRQRLADKAERQIHEKGKLDIEAIRSTQDDCSRTVNPDADLLRDKATNLNGK